MSAVILFVVKRIFVTPRQRDWTFAAAFGLMLIFTVIDIFWPGNAINNSVYDGVSVLVILAVLYFAIRRHPVERWIFIVAMTVMILSYLGLNLGFFSLFILGVGYDKWIHLIISAALFIFLFSWIAHDKRHYLSNACIVAFVVIGIGAINENQEFVGTRYLHVYNSLVFTQGDLLKAPTSATPVLFADFQVYDSEWDMLFNLFGEVIAIIVLGLREHYLLKNSTRKKRKKKR